jgi:hypothetical protein
MRLVLQSLADDGWLKPLGHGRWRSRSAEDRERVLIKRTSYRQAKSCVADLQARGVDASTGSRSGDVSVPVAFLRSLMAGVEVTP